MSSRSLQDDPSSQQLLEIYMHDYLIKKKFYLAAKSLRAERKMDSFLKHGIRNEPDDFLSTCWSTFWEVYFSTKRHPPPSPLFQVGPTPDFGANSSTADPRIALKAKIRRHLMDERNIIPENFQKLLNIMEDSLLKTPLKHPTPSSENVPVIVIDDDEEEERRRLAHNEEQLCFDPQELLKLLDDDDANRRCHKSIDSNPRRV